MKVNPLIDYASFWEAEERLQRKTEKIVLINQYLDRFTESELDMMIKYAVGVYQISEAKETDKLLREALKKKTA